MRENLLAWVRDYCNDPSLNDEGAIAIFLDRAEAWLNAHVSGVQSESLGDYSVAFAVRADVESFLPQSLIMFLRPYKKMKML
jgi:hypothetical protein